MAPRTRDRSILGVLAYLLLGPLVWAAHLLVVYGGHAALCALSGGTATMAADAVVAMATLAALAVLAFPLLRPHRMHGFLVGGETDDPEGRFRVATMRLLAALSAVGIAWAGMAAVLLPACAQLR